MKLKLIIIFSIVLLLSNIPPIYNILHLIIDEDHYCYSNGDGSMTCRDDIFKSAGMCKFDSVSINKSLILYKNRFGKSVSTKFYRLFWRNPLCFWRWREYFTEERYKMPYRDWEEIKKIRGENFQKTNFQAF